jgi:hypothetical protein
VPRPEATPQILEAVQALRTDLQGELPAPVTMEEAARALHAKDGYEWTAEDDEESARQFPTLIGQFLIDRDGLIRWVNVEGSRNGLADLVNFPAEEEFLGAAARLER